MPIAPAESRSGKLICIKWFQLRSVQLNIETYLLQRFYEDSHLVSRLVCHLPPQVSSSILQRTTQTIAAHISYQSNVFLPQPCRKNNGLPRTENSRGLPWLARQLNQKLSIDGKHMCTAIDLNHPLGNHVLVNHEWSQQDKESLSKNDQLSLDAALGRRWRKDTTPNAVVLRFIEGHAAPPNSSNQGHAHEIPGSYLTPLCQD